jgi:hypothetical protein
MLLLTLVSHFTEDTNEGKVGAFWLSDIKRNKTDKTGHDLNASEGLFVRLQTGSQLRKKYAVLKQY